MLDHECSQAVNLVGSKPVRFRQADRFEPKLRDIVALLDGDMRWLLTFHAVEEEAETRNP
jgi:hypothetical protein